MNVSVIATVLNEQDSIRLFLNDLVSQSRTPSEIVIVDGGSTDGTIDTIESIASKHPMLRLVVEKGCNVARGRNIAIEHARYDYIAMTDAGCRVNKHWLQELIKPFEGQDDVDVVGGRTEIDARNSFERWVGYLNKPFEKLDIRDYLPTARSLALRKRWWERVGGFPEGLSMWAEDAVFMLRLKAQHVRLVLAPGAIVYWRPRGNLKEFCRQYFEYGIGDGEARIHSMLFLKRLGLFLSVIFFFVGFAIDPIVPLMCLVVLLVAFIQIVLPLKTASLPWWKLIPLFFLTLVKEVSQLLGYCVGRSKAKRTLA